MQFFNAKCETCGQYHDRPGDLVAFTVRGGALKRIELGGEQPWSGVRVVCRRCVRFFQESSLTPEDRAAMEDFDIDTIILDALAETREAARKERAGEQFTEDLD